MRLGIDLDGVVSDFTAGWVDRYNDEFDAAVTHESAQVWGGLDRLTHFPDMGAFWDWASGHGRGSIFRHLETYDGAIDALACLYLDHEIVILTTKPEWAIHDTFAWLSEHQIPTREVHMLEEKWRVPCDVYLDDAQHQIAALHRQRPEAAVCRFVRPWNEPVAGVHDVNDWEEFIALVGRLSDGGS